MTTDEIRAVVDTLRDGDEAIVYVRDQVGDESSVGGWVDTTDGAVTLWQQGRIVALVRGSNDTLNPYLLAVEKVTP